MKYEIFVFYIEFINSLRVWKCSFLLQLLSAAFAGILRHIDIQSFSALIQRFLHFQQCSELNQQTLILTSLVITDSVMNTSEHL